MSQNSGSESASDACGYHPPRTMCADIPFYHHSFAGPATIQSQFPSPSNGGGTASSEREAGRSRNEGCRGSQLRLNNARAKTARVGVYLKVKTRSCFGAEPAHVSDSFESPMLNLLCHFECIREIYCSSFFFYKDTTNRFLTLRFEMTNNCRSGFQPRPYVHIAPSMS